MVKQTNGAAHNVFTHGNRRVSEETARKLSDQKRLRMDAAKRIAAARLARKRGA